MVMCRLFTGKGSLWVEKPHCEDEKEFLELLFAQGGKIVRGEYDKASSFVMYH